MFLILLFLFPIELHPYHVSVTEIKFKEEDKTLQISSRIFIDDLEEALMGFTKETKLDILKEENWDKVNTYLEDYMMMNLEVYDEKKRAEVNYVGAEIDNDVMWVYLEIEKVKKLRTLTITNSILLDTFEDQENIIHFRAFDKVKSTRLTKKKKQELFVWESK